MWSHDLLVPVASLLAVCSAADPHLAVPLVQSAELNPLLAVQVQSAWERALDESHDLLLPVALALASFSAWDPHLAVPLVQVPDENPSALVQVQSAYEVWLILMAEAAPIRARYTDCLMFKKGFRF